MLNAFEKLENWYLVRIWTLKFGNNHSSQGKGLHKYYFFQYFTCRMILGKFLILLLLLLDIKNMKFEKSSFYVKLEKYI